MNKQYSLLAGLLMISLSLFSQGVLITDDSSEDPDASAILELKTTSKGLLLPRLTGDEIDALSNPVAGLMVYNTTLNYVVIFNGSSWTTLDGEEASTSLEVGARYGGGVIFYLDGTGEHGLIAAEGDITYNSQSSLPYGCRGTTTGATSQTDGAANTAAILAACATTNIAARACDDYSVDMAGVTYDDWYLPAIDQLDSMYVHMDEIGGFDIWDYYISSTEASSNNAWRADFWDGSSASRSKNNAYLVRPIRSF